jgi:ABC-type Na+ efflux pump permease subunit
MVGKIMIGVGAALLLLGGVVLLGTATAMQLTQSGYSPSVQHYAEQNAAIGNPFALGLLVLGAMLAVAGCVLTLVHRVHQ